MFGPTTELIDSAGRPLAISYVVRGRSLLSWKKRRPVGTQVLSVGVSADGLSVTILTAMGRRLTVAGGQRLLVRGKAGKACWRPAKEVRVRTLLYAVSEGILMTDRVVGLVAQERPGEVWATVRTETGNVCAEDIVCRAA